MSSTMLPDGYTLRPAALEDVEEVVALFNRCSMAVAGETSHDVNEQSVDWRTPGFDLDRDTRVVLDGEGRIVGCAEVWDLEEPHVKIHCWGRVDPEHRGRGIGSVLLGWEEERGRLALESAPKDARVTLNCGAIVKDAASRDLLETNGFEPIRYFRRMVIEMSELPPEPTWPEAITVRGFDPDRDVEPALHAVRDTFSDHWGHVDTPFEEELVHWRHWIEEDAEFDPAIWFLAESDGRIVGQSLCWAKRPEGPEFGWIYIVGVDRGWRRRGLALALLRHSFRALYERGKKKVGLGVDAESLTGANKLYEKAGMKVARESIAYEKELRSGKDLALRTLDEGEESGERD